MSFDLTPDWRKRRRRNAYKLHAAGWEMGNEKDESPKNSGAVYLIICRETRNAYVGSSKDYRRRFNGHVSSLRNGTATKRLQAEHDKHGLGSLIFVPVERGIDLNLLLVREQFWMWRIHDQGRLLNISEHASFSAHMARFKYDPKECEVDLSEVKTEFLWAELRRRGFQLGRNEDRRVNMRGRRA